MYIPKTWLAPWTCSVTAFDLTWWKCCSAWIWTVTIHQCSLWLMRMSAERSLSLDLSLFCWIAAKSGMHGRCCRRKTTVHGKMATSTWVCSSIELETQSYKLKKSGSARSLTHWQLLRANRDVCGRSEGFTKLRLSFIVPEQALFRGSPGEGHCWGHIVLGDFSDAKLHDLLLLCTIC